MQRQMLAIALQHGCRVQRHEETKMKARNYMSWHLREAVAETMHSGCTERRDRQSLTDMTGRVQGREQTKIETCQSNVSRHPGGVAAEAIPTDAHGMQLLLAIQEDTALLK